MTWTYRVIKRGSEEEENLSLGIHEVYSDEGRPNHSWTENPVAPFGETVEELLEDIERFKKAAELPVLVEKEYGENKAYLEEVE